MSGRVRFRRRRGFTLVELLAYLGLFTTLTVVMLGAEVSASRMHGYEGAAIETLQQAHRAFEALRRDLAWAVRAEAPEAGGLRLAGAEAWRLRRRDGALVALGREVAAGQEAKQRFQRLSADPVFQVRSEEASKDTVLVAGSAAWSVGENGEGLVRRTAAGSAEVMATGVRRMQVVAPGDSVGTVAVTLEIELGDPARATVRRTFRRHFRIGRAGWGGRK
jgi:type II secretory pathway component PulJ